MRKPKILVPPALGMLLIAAPGFAGPPSSTEATVVATGTASLRQRPDVLRIQVDLLARGKNLKEALAKLKTRQESARQRLEALTPLPGSVVIGDPVLSTGKNERQRLLEKLLRGRLQGPGKKAAGPAKEAAAVIVSAPLKADLPLKVTSVEDLLIRATELQDKVRAWDLGGLQELQLAAPAEGELADEVRDLMGEDASQPRFGEVTFLFIRKIRDEDRAKILAEAVQNARAEAARLARAAGADLDGLRFLQHQPDAEGEEGGPAPGDLNLRFGPNRPRSVLAPGASPQAGEATATEAGLVTYRISVTAAFALKPSPR